MNRAGFDKYITVFSPEGSLYQVEYAFKAVTYPGLLTVAIRCKDAVLVATQHVIPDRLMRPDSVTMLYEVTPGIGCCMTGRAPDGRALVQRAREEASDYHYRYGVQIPIAVLAKRMGDKAHVRTQQAGLRPMGVVSTFIGMDQSDQDGALKPQIYTVDPAGWTCGHIACAVGKKQVEAMAFLEKRQKSTDFSSFGAFAFAFASTSDLLQRARWHPLSHHVPWTLLSTVDDSRRRTRRACPTLVHASGLFILHARRKDRKEIRRIMAALFSCSCDVLRGGILRMRTRAP